MITWTANGDKCEKPVILQGTGVGDALSERAAIDWSFPPYPEHPEWPTRITRADVQCMDGPEHSVEQYVQVTEVSHTAHTVLFHSNLFSFKRSIRLRASCSVEMCGPNTGRWFPLHPISTFACDLLLVVDPGPEPQTIPWSIPEGIEIRERTGGLKVQTRTNQPMKRSGATHSMAAMYEA